MEIGTKCLTWKPANSRLFSVTVRVQQHHCRTLFASLVASSLNLELM